MDVFLGDEDEDPAGERAADLDGDEVDLEGEAPDVAAGLRAADPDEEGLAGGEYSSVVVAVLFTVLDGELDTSK